MRRSASGPHVVWLSSRERRSFSRSLTSACRSRAIGRSSGEAARSAAGERSSMPPDSTAFRPATQPRQLISAITTVISATTAAMAANSQSTYLRVSSLRRCAKLMSCTIISSPRIALSALMGCAETCSGPSTSSSTVLRASRRSPGTQRTASG